MNRSLHLVTREDFWRHPIRAVWWRLYWRWHWKFRAERLFIVPFFGKMKIRLGPPSASLRIYLNGGFSDKETADIFIRSLRPGKVVIDCGAHIGEYTLLFAFLVGPEGQVHAFEPDPRVFSILQENILLNGLRNVYAHQKALGDKEGEAEFVLAKDPTTSSLLSFAREGGEKLRVPICTLDGYVRSCGLKQVDAIKIDVEGAEELVLAGAEQVLLDFRPGLIFIEIEGPGGIESVVQRLENHGYFVKVRRDQKHRFPHVIAIREAIG